MELFKCLTMRMENMGAGVCFAEDAAGDPLDGIHTVLLGIVESKMQRLLTSYHLCNVWAGFRIARDHPDGKHFNSLVLSSATAPKNLDRTILHLHQPNANFQNINKQNDFWLIFKLIIISYINIRLLIGSMRRKTSKMGRVLKLHGW